MKIKESEESIRLEIQQYLKTKEALLAQEGLLAEGKCKEDLESVKKRTQQLMNAKAEILAKLEFTRSEHTRLKDDLMNVSCLALCRMYRRVRNVVQLCLEAAISQLAASGVEIPQ